ncbi:MAG: tRNA lysidine(34) synthetase TilS [Deltaproteobacteria bacterium]|nr:tRNA lysidine(34) synthetase TilS [Deltaproteobacteria bacterium]
MALLEEDEHLLAGLTGEAWERVGRRLTPDLAVISLPALLALPSGLQKRVLRQALGQLNPGQEITLAQVESLLALAQARKSGGQVACGTVQAARAGAELHLWRRLPLPLEEPTPLSAPGEWQTPDGWRLRLEVRPCPPKLSCPGPAAACFDAGGVSLPLVLRHFRAGDRFWPLGGPGTRKLQDFLVDCKIPRWLRPHLPLVESGGRIVWVAGLRTAEDAKMTPETRQMLALEITPVSPYAVRVWEMLTALVSRKTTEQLG